MVEQLCEIFVQTMLNTSFKVESKMILSGVE